MVLVRAKAILCGVNSFEAKHGRALARSWMKNNTLNYNIPTWIYFKGTCKITNSTSLVST